jgi:uncharacterized membrane protein
MSVKIVLPARVILASQDGVIRFDHPLTCSRCSRTPAAFFETHRLKMRAGLRHNPLPGKRYTLEHSFKLKLRLCARCYHMDYLLAPETLEGDATPLGQLARTQNFLRMIGGLTAALGLLLLTPILPATENFAAIRAAWWIPMAAGVALVVLGLFSQLSAQAKVRRALESAGELDANLARAEVRTPLFASPEDLEQVALEVKFENEEWARECAAFKNWQVEKIPD